MPILIIAAMLMLALVFVLFGAGLDFAYVIPKRLARLAAIVLGGVCVATSAIVFQTIAGNRILTPAVMGYEAVYLLLQALLILCLGTQALAALSAGANMLLSMAVMLGYSWLLHQVVLERQRGDMVFVLLLGLVLAMVLGTFTQFVQLRISPGEFSILQGYSYASFSRARPAQLAAAGALVAAACAVLWKTLPVLDVLALGREQAISLGVAYRRQVRLYLALIALLVAVSTSLLGPTAFMGIFIANLSYALAGSSRHRMTLPLGCALAIGMFLLAQLLVEHVFNYKTTVSILINLLCGSYFLALMVRTRGQA